MERMIADRVAKAVAGLERDRIAQANPEGSSKASGCSHKTFMSGKPHLFNGTEGVVGLTRWIEKVEQVFGTCKCAEEDQVMYATSTFEGRALTWWNGNLKTLGSENANKIPWDEFKTIPASLHEVIEMARELVEQSIQSKAARANDGVKRKWDDNRREEFEEEPEEELEEEPGEDEKACGGVGL
nr:hypothetical protein [Tanacetum cinerariifolium]